MSDLFQNEYLLENLLFGEIILHVVFINCLDCDTLSSEFMDAQSDLTESTFANEFHELVEVKGGLWDLFILFDISLVILDQLFSLKHDLVVQVDVGIAILNLDFIWIVDNL